MLARTFGWWNVDAFLERLDPRQFDEWQAAYLVDPWGDDRADVRIGQLACAVESLVRTDLHFDAGDFVLSRPVVSGGGGAGEWQPLDDQAEAWRLFAARYEL